MTPRSSEVGRPGNVTIVRRGGSKLDGGMIAEVLGRIADDGDYPDWIGAWASPGTVTLPPRLESPASAGLSGTLPA
jgi:hypothetical protein